MSTAGGQLPVHVQDKPIEGNKRKIETLRIENLMSRAGKVSVIVGFYKYVTVKPPGPNRHPLNHTLGVLLWEIKNVGFLWS